MIACEVIPASKSAEQAAEKIAEQLGLKVAEVTEIRCIAENEMISLEKYLDAEGTKERRYKRAPGKM